MCPHPGSNQGPQDLQSRALPAELYGLFDNLGVNRALTHKKGKNFEKKIKSG